jgi:hypothetical protein
VRRVWEERRDFSQLAGLDEIFPPESAESGSRAATVSGALLAFTLAVVALLRYARGRGFRAQWTLALLLALAAAAVSVLRIVAPPPAAVTARTFTLWEGARRTRIVRLDARVDGIHERELAGDFPIVLGPGGEWRVLREAATSRLTVPMRAGATRMLVLRGTAPSPDPLPFDLTFGPRGLARPGGVPIAPVEFLREHHRDEHGHPTIAGIALRRLLVLADPPPRSYGVALPSADRLEMHVRPAR